MIHVKDAQSTFSHSHFANQVARDFCSPYSSWVLYCTAANLRRGRKCKNVSPWFRMPGSKLNFLVCITAIVASLLFFFVVRDFIGISGGGF